MKCLQDQIKATPKQFFVKPSALEARSSDSLLIVRPSAGTEDAKRFERGCPCCDLPPVPSPGQNLCTIATFALLEATVLVGLGAVRVMIPIDFLFSVADIFHG